MTKTSNKLRGFIMAVAAAAFALSLLNPYPVKAVETGQLSKKELKSLIKTASTPAEHLRVASYYHSEATRLRAQAAEHEAMQPMSSTSKVWAARGMNHCQYWIAEFTKGAQQADAKAVQHERMAAEAGPRASLTFAAMGK